MRFTRITIDPVVMQGAPSIRSTRLTVGAVLGQLAAGRTVAEVLKDYPYLEREDVLEAIAFAAANLDRELPLAESA